MKGKIVSMLLALLCASTLIFAQDVLSKPKEGNYTGTTEDGSTFQLKLVRTNGTLQVKEVGYRFIPTGMTIERVFMKSGKAFGEMKGDKLTFQIPVLLKFSFSANLLSESGGSTTIAWYKGELNGDKSDEINCTLTKIESPGKEYSGKFSMEDITLGPAPEGTSMKGSYNLILKLSEN